jgi:hypothetical protein
MLLAETAATRILGKKGIRFNGRDYIAPELTEYAGKPAVLKYDESDIGRLYVYVGNQFICVAECPEITGISQREVAVVTKKHIKKHLTAQAREMKAYKKEISEDIVNLVIEHRVESSDNVEWFPRPAVEHFTPALEQAGIAAGVGSQAVGLDSEGVNRPAGLTGGAEVIELKRVVYESTFDDSEPKKLRTLADLLAEQRGDDETLSRSETVERLYGAGK